jgi:hypothetical protein
MLCGCERHGQFRGTGGVGRDHDLLTRTSIQKGSARLRALVKIQVKPAAPAASVGVSQVQTTDIATEVRQHDSLGGRPSNGASGFQT